MAVKRAQAYCAVGPEGLIDIDLIRRSSASCQYAASNIHNTPWPRLVAKGWEVVPVRITAEDDADGDKPMPRIVTIDAEPSPAPIPRRAAPAQAAPGGEAKIGLFRCDR